jgi:excisionase family DNA binding protein
MKMTTIDLQRRLLRIDEVAALLDQGQSTVYRKVKAGVIPGGVRLGNGRAAIRVDSLELAAWLYPNPAELVSPPETPEAARRTAGSIHRRAAVEAPRHSGES